MLLPFIVCLFGHRRIDEPVLVEERLRVVIEEIVDAHKCVEFLVGREGEFDLLASSVIKDIKRRKDCPDCSLTLIMPYLKADFLNNQQGYEDYYDSVQLCEEFSANHPKSAIKVRNRYMVDRSDLCIFYVASTSGGAYQTMRYARRRGKNVINLGEKLL